MSLVPARDHLGEFLLLLDSTAGRDKVGRLLQYGSKAAKWRAESTHASEDRIQMWTNIMTTMSLVRKVLRMFKMIGVLRQMRAAAPADWHKVDLPLALNLAAKFCLANYYFWDQCTLANKLGMWKPSDNKQVTRANNLTEGFWLFEIIFTLLEQSVRLQRLNAPVGVRAVVDSFSTAAIASASLPAGVAAARSVAVRTFIRNLCDLPIACHFLQLGPFATHPHGHFGLLGVASSAISLYDLWPTITVAVPAKTV